MLSIHCCLFLTDPIIKSSQYIVVCFTGERATWKLIFLPVFSFGFALTWESVRCFTIHLDCWTKIYAFPYGFHIFSMVPVPKLLFNFIFVFLSFHSFWMTNLSFLPGCKYAEHFGWWPCSWCWKLHLKVGFKQTLI